MVEKLYRKEVQRWDFTKVVLDWKDIFNNKPFIISWIHDDRDY